jgi:molybdopterin molybdotransferase
MLSVAEAQKLILERVPAALPPARLPLAEALGLALAEEVRSDLDLPPFDKAMMDGFAIRADDLASGGATLTVVETVTAGRTPTRTVGPGQAVRIMTGAPMPAGADAVVIVERSQGRGDQVVLEDKPPRPGQHILRRGKEMKQGEIVLSPGTRLGPAEIGVLAAVGTDRVSVVPRPTAAVLSTGDEIVEPAVTPGPGQIRNSNAAMLVAQIQRAGAAPQYLGIAPDRLETLRGLVAQGLTSPVLALTGGVSAGKLDLVPHVLAELQVEPVFHKVEMKPGKPVFFGVGPGHAASLVFGLPGNPVSAMVCFELFVRPALNVLQGRQPGPRTIPARLEEDYTYRTDRPTYHPARLTLADDGWRVRMLGWFGSPDLRGVMGANGFAVLPKGDHTHRAGERLEVIAVEID